MNVFRLTRLRHFCTVAERSSIGLAAQILKVSQPALTRSIHRLEEEFGEPLFERSSRGVTLSPLGSTLLPYARAILAEADRATEDWQNLKLKGDRAARVKLGISPNFVRYVVPDALESFVRRYPDANVEVVTGTAEQLLAMLSSAQIDLGLTLVWRGTMDAALGRLADISQKRLARLSASVYAPAGHRLAGQSRASIEELHRERWAVPHSLSISWIFRGAFLGRELRPPLEILFTSNLSLIVDACKRLDLLTIVPEHVVADEVQRGAMVPLPCDDLRFDYTVSVLGRRRGTHTPALNHFVDLLEQGFLNLGLGPADVDDERRAVVTPAAAAPPGSPAPRRRRR